MAVTNPYFEFTPPFVPGTKVRSDAANTQFDALQAAFDLLPGTADALTTGTATFAPETGTGNAYVVTMPETRTSYQDGDEVVFVATHTNTGAATLEVDSLGTRAIVRADGVAVAAGDLVSGLIYVMRYDAASSQFQLVGPSTSYLTDATTQATAAATSATNAASSETNAASSEALAEEWASNAVDDDVSGNPGTYSSLHWATGAQAWAEQAEDSAIAAGFGGDGSTTFSAMHWANKAAASAVRGVVNTDINTSTPPTTEAVTGAHEIYDLADDDLLALIGFAGAPDLTVRNYMHGGQVRLVSEDTAGVSRVLLVGDPDGELGGYHAGTQTWRTVTAANGGLEANNTETGAGFERVLTESDMALTLGFEDLTDPGANQIMFWDDGAGNLTWLTANTGLAISGTDLNIDIDSETLMPNTIDGTNDLLLMYDDSVGAVYKVAIDDVANAGSGFVPASRTVTAGDGLSGGGDLSANRTFDVTVGIGLAIESDDVTLSHLGFEDLTDPNDDRIAFWDDSAGAFAWLDPGSGLSITTTSIAVDASFSAHLEDLDALGAVSAADRFMVSTGAGAWGYETVAQVLATLSLEIGADVQAYNAVLDDLSGLSAVSGANQFIVSSGAGAYAHETASQARSSLGLVIGTNVQAQSAHLDDLNSLGAVSAADRFMVSTGSGAWSYETAAQVRATLDLEVGTDVQAQSAHLDDLNPLGAVPGEDRFMVSSGAGAWGYETAAQVRATLDLEVGTDVQAFDAFLDDIAGLTDPGGDRILFWDDSAGAVTWLTPGTNLSIGATSINVTGLTIGTNVQAQSAHLDDLNALGVVPGADRVMVSTGSGAWAYESGATLRTSLGLGTGNSPQFNAINVGNASDTTITRDAAGQIAVEGDAVFTHDNSAYTSAKITYQNGGSPSGGSNGDMVLIY